MTWALAALLAIEVLPQDVTLRGREARQQLVIPGGAAAAWVSANPAVARVDAFGVVTPVANGEAMITARAGAESATVRVRVSGLEQPFAWSFRNHVIPVLTKQGCNQGACHGALAGKNGFKLTLRGYDPDADYDALTRQSLGRRVTLADPAASLMLLKPSFGVPHGGGVRLKKDSLEYRVLREWIAAGAAGPAENDPRITAIEVLPSAVQLQTGAEQQLAVVARYSDGHAEDVTRWAKYASNNEGSATVDEAGRVRMLASGEAAITVWFSSRLVYARVTSPYPREVSYGGFRPANFLDELALKKWQSLRIAPSPPASDSEFLRRAYLDTIGVLPTAEEAEAFLADAAPDKRTKLAGALLAREEYADYWAYKWSDLFLVSTRKLSREGMYSFYSWIRENVQANRGWDAYARDIFTGQGSTRRHGALNYYLLHKDPIDLTETTTQAFLGERLTCARCHNHPLEKWTQTQYFQLANLFARVGVKDGAEPGESIVYAKSSGDILHPKLGRPLPPAPLEGPAIEVDAPGDRRAAFVDWLVTAPGFSRAIVNRVWANFFGRGLADPVDDVRASNPASNQELFDALVKDFAAHGYDIQRLIRLILTSSLYQLSSEANATNANDDRFYSKYLVKRLPAEVLLDAMSQVTGAPTAFPDYPRGTRAMQLPETRVQSRFLEAFGRPPRIVCDAGERSSVPTVAQALHVVNGDTLNQKLSASGGAIANLLNLGMGDRRIVEHFYLAALSRYPRDAERDALLAALAAAREQGRKAALEDLVWALLTSKEFLFNY